MWSLDLSGGGDPFGLTEAPAVIGANGSFDPFNSDLFGGFNLGTVPIAPTFQTGGEGFAVSNVFSDVLDAASTVFGAAAPFLVDRPAGATYTPVAYRPGTVPGASGGGLFDGSSGSLVMLALLGIGGFAAWKAFR